MAAAIDNISTVYRVNRWTNGRCTQHGEVNKNSLQQMKETGIFELQG